MSELRIRLLWFHRQLRAPLTIGQERLEERLGFFVEAEDEKGRKVLAECAPLPGLHREKLAQAAQVWEERLGPALQTLDWQRWNLLRPYFGLKADMPLLQPAIQTSVEMLLLKLSLTRGVFPESVAPLSKEFEHSALCQLPRVPNAAWWQSLQELRRRGVRCLKVKIGREVPEFEQVRLSEIRSLLGPEARFRLDANQGLDDKDFLKWRRFLDRGDWPIEYLEEPSRGAREILGSRWAIAYDESLEGIDPLAEDCIPELAVLKPNRLGLSRAIAWMQVLDARGGRAVLSNAYESELSLQLYAWLYARFVRRPEALGFGTLHAFAHLDAKGPLAPFAAHAPWPENPSASLDIPGLKIVASKQIWPRLTEDG